MSGATQQAPIRVAEQHKLDLAHALRVPVLIDDTGWSRGEIEFLYRRGREFHPTGVKVGRETLLQDVAAVGDVYLHFAKYNSALARIRELNLDAHERTSIERDVQERQLQFMGHGTVRFGTLLREIEYLDALVVKYRIKADSAPLSTRGREGEEARS